MAEYLSPGVYMEEVNSGPRPIEGVGTAVAAFVGFAPAGPVNRPVLVTNWSQYVDTFGAPNGPGRREAHMKGAYLSHAVYGFFLNRGGRAYVTRVSHDQGGSGSSVSSLTLPSRASKDQPSLTLQLHGQPKGEVEVVIGPAAGENVPEGSFTIRVRYGQEEEVYENVSLSKAKGLRNVLEVVNAGSRVLRVSEAGTAGAVAERAPAEGSYRLRASALPQVSQRFAGDVAERSGIEGLAIAEDATMICCPDLMSAYEAGVVDRAGVKAVQSAMMAHCERMGDRVAILDPLPALSPQQVKQWRRSETNYDSKFASLYYPWISVAGPDGKAIAVPPCGHLAGIFARNDNERGVHKAPANEVVLGALEAATPITKGEQDTLNPDGVNCIRSFSGRGVRVWGARTLSSDPAWRYVNVRRLFNYVEKSIERGTQWVVFEPNGPDLWARLRRDVSAFLNGVWRDGALFGASPAEAYFVKCDEELNPPDVRDRGQLVIEVGLAPVKPAEFVIFRLSQFAGGGA